MKQLPTFEPYVLTPWDHCIPPVHLAAFLTFRLDKPSNAIPVLEAGITRLINLLPFLGGNVASSTRIPGKENVLEVQPSTQAFTMQHPVLKIRHHKQSIFPTKSSPTVSYDRILNDDFIPIPFALAGEDPSPVFRFQANLMLDGIILCFNFHHTALDGVGVVNVIEALATCCQGSSSLRTSPEQEQEARQTIFKAASTTNIITKPHEDCPPHLWEFTPSSTSQDPASRKLVLDAGKIAKLKKLCSALLQRQSDTQPVRISSNTVVTAVIWLCFIRARFGQLATTEEPIPANSCALLACESRSIIQPKIPAAYMGNAIIVKEAYTPLGPIMSSTYTKVTPTSRTSIHIQDDIHLLANIASSVHAALQSATNEHIHEVISKVAASDDWTSPVRPGDVNFSSLRSFKIYEIDFGPCLGKVQDFDLPENRIPGATWVLPSRYGQSSPWEVRLTLEPDVMEKVQKDILMKWVGSSEDSKL
jgi:hypothetical protein